MIPIAHSQTLPNGRKWPPLQGRWTHADWMRIPECSTRYERIGGELLVSPPPNFSHQDVIAELISRMRVFARVNKAGKVVGAPIGVVLPGKSADVQPDLLFVARNNLAIIKKDMIYGAPDLVVEVLSPSNWHRDRGDKLELYRTAKVSEYWIVDCELKTVEKYVLKNKKYRLEKISGMKDTVTSTQLKGFSIRVKELFAK